MKATNSTPITPILTVIGSEIAAAHQLLIGFEHAINQAALHPNLKIQIQGFDLALQILNDIEHLTDVLSQQFSAEAALPHPLPTSGVRLERIREKLSQNKSVGAARQDPAPAVDLF